MYKKPLVITIILLGSIILGSIIWYNTALSFRSKNTENELLTINTGQSTAAILSDLEAKKLIGSSLAVKIYLYRHQDIKLQAGEYEFKTNTPTRQLINDLSLGRSLSQEVTILFREGLTVKEMQAELSKNGFLTDNSFLEIGKTPIKDLPLRLALHSFIKELPASTTLEGYLFPDTYRLYKNFTAEDLAAKMLDNFEHKLTPELRASIKAKGHSLTEAITMASLLEKEVRTEGDMKIVAGVFWDRIEVGQALQSCASLAYILGVNKAQYTYEDTQIVSPYNTYQHRGLPPGPIGNPGLRAINAAINPTETNYNYFLSRPDTGETVFSETLDQHNEAKVKYL